jgi:osmotically-inducible protein OsmY
MMTLTPLPPARPVRDASVDEDLCRRIRLFFNALGLAALRRIHVEVEAGLVTVDGVVRSYYERQLALACVRRVAGVRQIIDNIRVGEF